MEERTFKGRLEEVAWINQQNGREPLTEDDKIALDSAVRMFTHLD